MAVWRLYRHHNSDGSSKDWAVQTNPDDSISTRWGKTANHLPGLSTRRGIRQFDIERAKQAKGYVFVAEVEIDSDGQVFLPGHVMPEPQSPAVGTLYWHIECRNNPESRSALASEVRRLFTVMPSLFDKETMPNQYWGDWLPLLDLSISDQPFIQSGQIKQTEDALPWLFLMALKHKAIVGVDIGIATESGREVSADLKVEQDILMFFGTNLDSIRATAERLGLLKPRLNLALVLSDSDDCWF